MSTRNNRQFLPDSFKFSSKAISKMKKLKVGIVYLYGSYAEKVNRYNSDFDLGVVFQDLAVLKNSLRLYSELYDLFSNELPVTFQKEVDIVFLQRAPISLKFEAINKGKVLFETSPYLRVKFEEEVIRKYLDFAPYLKEYEKVTKEMFNETGAPESPNNGKSTKRDCRRH